jgi:hypothetical protein
MCYLRLYISSSESKLSCSIAGNFDLIWSEKSLGDRSELALLGLNLEAEVKGKDPWVWQL